MTKKSAFNSGFSVGTQSFSLLLHQPSLLIFYIIPAIIAPLIIDIVHTGSVTSHGLPIVLALINFLYFMNLPYILDTPEFYTHAIPPTAPSHLMYTFVTELTWVLCAAAVALKTAAILHNVPLSFKKLFSAVTSKIIVFLGWTCILVFIRMLTTNLFFLGFDHIISMIIVVFFIIVWKLLSFFAIQALMLNSNLLKKHLILTTLTRAFRLIIQIFGAFIPVGIVISASTMGALFLGILAFTARGPINIIYPILGYFFASIFAFIFCVVISTVITVLKTTLYLETKTD